MVKDAGLKYDFEAEVDAKIAEQLERICIRKPLERRLGSYSTYQDFTVALLKDLAMSFYSKPYTKQEILDSWIGDTKEKVIEYIDSVNFKFSEFGAYGIKLDYSLYMDGLRELADEFGLKLPEGVGFDYNNPEKYGFQYNSHIQLSLARRPTIFVIYYELDPDGITNEFLEERIGDFKEKNKDKVDIKQTKVPYPNSGELIIGPHDGIPLKVLSRAHRMSHELGLRHTPHTYTFRRDALIER